MIRGGYDLNILFLHPNFPGQYLYLAPYLARRPENKVCFLSKNNSIQANLVGVTLGLYKEPEEKAQQWSKTCGPLRPAAEVVLDGQQIVRSLNWFAREQDFRPDIVIGHTGWGSTLYVKDVYPEVPVLGYFEWYYHAEHSDSYWWPDEIPSIESRISIRTRNAHHLLNLEACDAGITPTGWQKEQFPKEFQYKLHQLHEGIDTLFCQPAPEKPGLRLEDMGIDLPAGTEIITYVARGLEVYRGFPQFMDAIRIVLDRRPRAHVIIVGDDRICYGPQLMGTTYRTEEEKKGGYDKERVHFVGVRNRGDYRKILQASGCHVYLTRPFVLSWSMLEAMSFGCAIAASDTPPVLEVMEDRVNGLLADFRSPQQIAERVEEILDDSELAARLGQAARETILDRFELQGCLQKQEKLVYRLTGQQI